MPRKLGQLENAALALAQMRNLGTMRVGELASGLRLSAKQERELLSRMSRSGMIANVRKGLYLFPPRLPLGGIWTPDEATAINALMVGLRVGMGKGPGATVNHDGMLFDVPRKSTARHSESDEFGGARTGVGGGEVRHERP